MAYQKIGDYGAIGDCNTVALVSKAGSVDWLCLPYLDSPSVFAAILDDEKGGFWRIQPIEPWDSAQSYLQDTNILVTRFRTRGGEVELIDFMPVANEKGEGGAECPRLIRRVRGISGKVALLAECMPRFDYGAVQPLWQALKGSAWRAGADREQLVLQSTAAAAFEDGRISLTIKAGQTVWLVLTYGKDGALVAEEALPEMLASTAKYWRDWVVPGPEAGGGQSDFWQDQLERSKLVLKLLQQKTTGAIAAAATTSLPAIVFGARNWDYRYSWVRDTAMTLKALLQTGHQEEYNRYLDFLMNTCGRDPGKLNLVCSLRRSPVSDETVIPHLSGYKGSYPVHIGQRAVRQRQHDIYGELIDSVHHAASRFNHFDTTYWPYLQAWVAQAMAIWREPDDGLWEMRIGQQHFTHSKLLCWVALDRGIKIAEQFGLPADFSRWRAEREAVRDEILEKGINKHCGCFTQHYGTDAVDAALLRIPLLGFLPIDDPRVANTIAAIESRLMVNGVMLRYRTDDGLPGLEQGFLICLFWYLRCLILQERLDEVETHLLKVSHYSNHLGLYGEQYDPVYQEITGNFPQAYSHIGYMAVVVDYIKARQRARS